jgi:hypothetical protein
MLLLFIIYNEIIHFFDSVCGIARELSVEIFHTDPALCGIARELFVEMLCADPTLCSIARDKFTAMRHSAGNRNRNRIRKYFRVFICDLGVIEWRKKPEVKNLVTLSL